MYDVFYPCPQENNLYYVTTVTAHVSPVCQGRSSKTEDSRHADSV